MSAPKKPTQDAPQTPPLERRHPGVDIRIRYEELPSIEIIADNEEDYERFRLWLERAGEIGQLYQFAWSLSVEKRYADLAEADAEGEQP